MLTDISKGISVKDFSKTYGKGTKEKVACSSIDFSAEMGQVIGLLGPNGAGKSTLLKSLAGIQYPTSGIISVCGTEDFREIRKLTGYVPEFPELDKKLTVYETLYLEAKLHGITEPELQKNIEKALELAELKDVANQKIGVLSKGYTQRTSFAKAISHNPKVLILDEFSGGLDPAQTVRMRKNVKKLSQKKIVIHSTHRIEEAEQLCDYIYVMHGGSIVAKGTIQDLVSFSGKKNLEDAFLFLTGEK